MSQTTSIKMLILGSKHVGKSALAIRFLTKRFIGEYKSNCDMYYKREMVCDELLTNIEILDYSRCEQDESKINVEEIREAISWADGYVIIYSITDSLSFKCAQDYLRAVTRFRRRSVNYPVILLGNKRDLETRREVDLRDGRGVAVEFGCQFYEISAADSYVGVSLAFESLVREIRSVNSRRSRHHHHSHHLSIPKKLSLETVSRVFGAVFGRHSSSSLPSSSSHYIQCSNGSDFEFEYKPKTSTASLNSCQRKKIVLMQPSPKQSLPVVSL